MEDGEGAVQRGARLDVRALLRPGAGRGRSGERETREEREDPSTPHLFGYKQLGMSVSRARAYIGLGSNLGEREATLRAALERLAAGEEIDVVAVSSFRETDPVGKLDQPRFVNAAAALDTGLAPRELLERLLEVERGLGRDRAREERWGPRTIDLDLLLYGDEEIDEPGLSVPHPRLAERAFVLEPLLDLDPELRLPDGRRLRDLYAPELE
jgi:2-amino-4-hydroxy-6-hydroxymethyldihydropteridine diphosphokinase